MKYSYKLYNIIKQAFFSLVNSDDSAYPSGQATVNTKSIEFTRVSTYGICANPTDGSHVLLFNSQGQESIQFGIINDFINRKKNLLEGEVVLFNTKTESYVYLKSDGSVEIKASAVNIIDSTVNISSGDVIVTGGDVIADGISLKTHFHQGNLGFPVDVPIQTAGGTTPSNLPTANTNGEIIDGPGTNLSIHTHSQPNDTNGDSEFDTSTPL